MSELVCDSLTKVYKGSKRALDEVSFSVASRGIFALIGRNGAGKTTLIRILATELEPSSGSASINGVDVMGEAKKLRERIAIVPQEARAISWMTPMQTVVSSLLWRGFPYGDAKKGAREALAKLGLDASRDVLNRSLSGGTRRKVLLATVIASEAEVVFLDEPTTGLDPISRRELWVILRELGRERFTFLTTHYLEEAEQLAERIGILKDGKLVGVGSLDELRNRARYQYSVKLPSSVRMPDGVTGEVTVGENGQTQVMTNEAEAFELSRRLSDGGVRFSISPTTLDDVFFFLVRQGAGDD